MKTFKQLIALLLVFVLVAACVPLGTITAFAAENDEASLSAVEAEIDAGSEDSTEPTETDNEAAPPPDESAGTEPEEEHSSTEAPEEDSLPSEPEEETPEPSPDEEETEPDPENPFLDLANEFDLEVLVSCGSCSRMAKSPWISILWISSTRTPPTAAAPALKPVTAAVEVMQQAVVPVTWLPLA